MGAGAGRRAHPWPWAGAATEAARQAAEAKQREAAKAKQAVDATPEAALWEDGFDLVVDEDKPDHTIPPPIPAAALLARTEAARRAEAEAQQAQAQATAAAQVAEKAQRDRGWRLAIGHGE